MYRLKQNVAEFEVVDGPLAGRCFQRGKLYDEIPSGDAGKFETVKEKGTTVAPAVVKIGSADNKQKTAIIVPPGETGEVKS